MQHRSEDPDESKDGAGKRKQLLELRRGGIDEWLRLTKNILYWHRHHLMAMWESLEPKIIPAKMSNRQGKQMRGKFEETLQMSDASFGGQFKRTNVFVEIGTNRPGYFCLNCLNLFEKRAFNRHFSEDVKDHEGRLLNCSAFKKRCQEVIGSDQKRCPLHSCDLEGDGDRCPLDVINE